MIKEKPRTNLPCYITDTMMAELDQLAMEFTRGNRTEMVRQCLAIGIEKFKTISFTNSLMGMPRDAVEIE